MWNLARELLTERLPRLLATASRRIRVWAFYKFDKHKVKNLKTNPADIAYAVVGGKIRSAYPFRNLGNKHAFVVAAVSKHDSLWTYKVCLLEAFSSGFRKVWESDELFSWDQSAKHFKLQDIDRDGFQELTFASVSYGSGGGSESLYLYIPTNQKLYEFRIDSNWQDHLQPNPQIFLFPESPNKADRVYLAALEKMTSQTGFLESFCLPDENDPSYATFYWHKDNGDLKTGPVTIRYYDGFPAHLSSVIAEVEDQNFIWTAYFKGPVVGYLKKEKKHFIPYCPSYIYHWPLCLYFTGRFLFIGTRGDGIIRYDRERQQLEQILLKYQENTLKEVSSIRFEGGFYLIEENLRVHRSQFESTLKKVDMW